LFAQIVMSIIHPLLAAASNLTVGEDAGKAISIGVGAGGGAAGAGAGIGMLFGKVYESNSRQPEMAADLIGLQWLGFALTEATFFYGLVGGLIGYVLA
jgi:F-type H+-transporting ATPase subunit c